MTREHRARDNQARDYPAMVRPVAVEPVPRRVRAMLGGSVVLDTTAARYVWEWPNYPAYYIPLSDIRADFFIAGDRESTPWGTARRDGLQVGEVCRARCAWVYGDDAQPGLRDTARFEFSALDAWYEEDEQIFVHPRNPYTRVDALRSSRRIRVELNGTVLAESPAPVLLFETGLPTRYYLSPVDVDFTHLVATDAVSECPYKGRTTGYWSVRLGGTLHDDLAWVYHYPTPAVSAIAGLIAFYNEQVDIVLDGQLLPRPTTHFFPS
ncbi:MAG TPA: DUF427 domain-containing protein [Pseudonocardia sp.]|nr:DUF427 domain-containing protein [Pseudonocardia sp.]